MTPKQEALIKDLAALFVKYRVSDWLAVIEGLESTRFDFTRCLDLIKKLDEDRPKIQVKKRKTTTQKISPRLKDETIRQHVVELIEKKLRSLKTSDNTNVYRKLLMKTGSKFPIPSNKDAIIHQIALQLAELSPADLKKFFEDADVEEVDTRKDYERWVKIISGDHGKK